MAQSSLRFAPWKEMDGRDSGDSHVLLAMLLLGACGRVQVSIHRDVTFPQLWMMRLRDELLHCKDVLRHSKTLDMVKPFGLQGCVEKSHSPNHFLSKQRTLKLYDCI